MDSFNPQPNCSSLFYNLLLSVFLSLRRVGKLPRDQIHSIKNNNNLKRKKVWRSISSPSPFLSLGCRMSGGRIENEWTQRSRVDKIRGERQEGCRHDRRERKQRRSHSGGFTENQQRRRNDARSAPSPGGDQYLHFLFTQGFWFFFLLLFQNLPERVLIT